MRITKQNLKVHIYFNKDWCIDWHKNKLRHREDGTSTIWSDGDEYYYINGEHYFKDKNKDKYWKKAHANY